MPLSHTRAYKTDALKLICISPLHLFAASFRLRFGSLVLSYHISVFMKVCR